MIENLRDDQIIPFRGYGKKGEIERSRRSVYADPDIRASRKNGYGQGHVGEFLPFIAPNCIRS